MLIKVQKLLEGTARKTELAAVNPAQVQSIERESIDGFPNACRMSFGLETMTVNERLEDLVDRVNAACEKEWAFTDEPDDDPG